MAGASPPTAESAAPTERATLVVAMRMAGTAFSAGVLPGFPALSPVEYWAGVIAGPAGFSGPATCVNRPLARSWLVTAASGAGSFHTGVVNRKIRLVGLAEDCGKCLLSSVVPAAESLPPG